MSIQPTKEDPVPAGLWNEKGELQRPASQFRDFITNEPEARFAAERGRYHLYVSYACPWAHRTLIVRKLKGLEDIISVTVVHYHNIQPQGWHFVTSDEKLSGEDCVPDPLHPDFKLVRQLYFKAEPEYKGRFSVPVLWDKKLETIVSNESSEIIRMLNAEFDHLLPQKFRDVDLYPEKLRSQIDGTNQWTYDTINNGVYKCGIAKTQEAYQKAFRDLFEHLDQVETHLQAMEKEGPFYFGPHLTEADVRLYVTIIRFDPVYFTLFKTNSAMIRYGYPAIHKWMQNLFWTVPAFRDTTNFEHIKKHYFMSLTFINPTGIVPDGPLPVVEPL